MRGLSTYFKGSFEFSKRPRVTVVKLSRSEGKLVFSGYFFFSCYDTEPLHRIEYTRLVGIDPGLGRTL